MGALENLEEFFLLAGFDAMEQRLVSELDREQNKRYAEDEHFTETERAIYAWIAECPDPKRFAGMVREMIVLEMLGDEYA